MVTSSHSMNKLQKHIKIRRRSPSLTRRSPCVSLRNGPSTVSATEMRNASHALSSSFKSPPRSLWSTAQVMVTSSHSMNKLQKHIKIRRRSPSLTRVSVCAMGRLLSPPQKCGTPPTRCPVPSNRRPGCLPGYWHCSKLGRGKPQTFTNVVTRRRDCTGTDRSRTRLSPCVSLRNGPSTVSATEMRNASHALSSSFKVMVTSSHSMNKLQKHIKIRRRSPSLTRRKTTWAVVFLLVSDGERLLIFMCFCNLFIE
jgi:hypothetical protein